MRGSLTRFLAAILVLSVVGCGAPTPRSGGYGNYAARDAYRVPVGAKVGLAPGFDPAVTERDPNLGPRANSENIVVSGTIESCFKGQGLVILPLCLVTAPLVFGTLASLVVVKDSIKKADPQVDEKTPEDLTAESKATAVTESLSGLTPFSVRIKSIARAAKLRDLANVTDSEASESDPKRVDLRRNLDYVFELAPLEVEALKVQTLKGTYVFRFTAKGRLVRLRDDLIVSEFLRGALTDFKAIGSWTAEETELLAMEFDRALNALAKEFVHDWIEPALASSR